MDHKHVLITKPNFNTIGTGLLILLTIVACSQKSDRLRVCLNNARSVESKCTSVCTDRSAYDDNIQHYGVCQNKCFDAYANACKKEEDGDE